MLAGIAPVHAGSVVDGKSTERTMPMSWNAGRRQARLVNLSVKPGNAMDGTREQKRADRPVGRREVRQPNGALPSSVVVVVVNKK
jgi:hypothetical protein